ncbi:MAG: phosphatase PAP2 family protein [Rhodoblastus sp.]
MNLRPDRRDFSEIAPSPAAARNWAIGLVCVVAAVVVSYVFVDRPIARYLYDNLHHRQNDFRKLTYVSEVVQAASVLIVAWGVWLYARRRPIGPVFEPLIRASAALCVAFAMKDQLKYAFGRTWPETWVNNNPSFIKDGVFGFFPFHGGTGWSAFPSGHTATISAFAATLWMLWPKGRPLCAAAVAIPVTGLLGADYHWVSDIIAGGALGAAIGVVAARIRRGGVSA